MSDQDGENSPMRTEASHRNATHNESMEDALTANNSIIGKVKSRVSSIFPNSLSKWFSPSAKNNNDSLNGSINNNSNISRRRRRIEVEEEEVVDEEEDDEEDVEDDDEEHGTGEFDDNLFALEPDRNDGDNSDESDEAVTNVTTENLKSSRRGILRTTAVRQPPTKRSRLNLDHTFITNSNRNTPLIQRQPLLSSTPDIGGGNLSTQFSSGSCSTNRYTHLNLYDNQGRKEPAYNFNSSPVVNAMVTSKDSPRYDPDIIDLVPEEAVDSNIRSGGADLISSRRSLNIPSTSSYTTTERCSTGLSNLKRQSLASVKNNLSSLPRRTSTKIFETDSSVGNMSMRAIQHQQQQQTNIIIEEREEFEDNNNNEDVANDLDGVQQAKQCNGKLTFKRQKLTNGAGVPLHKTKNTPLLAEGVNVRDSASESSDGGGGKAEASAGSSSGVLPRKSAGLFNRSVGNSRNGSRTSSFGNGLNFYTHLEGRKSLFAGGTGPQAGISGGMALNNSTLSLTSLNRRQFNASIYGSTSALSDSRLLNTFSPFYKGKTTYGGAAAYNKHTMAGTGTGAGASVVRITPTLIRPTSSLSTLSSSNNSTSAGGIHIPENPSAISSTAKRILDLINDFATPLSEAKKMASNLKPGHHHHQPQLNQSSSKRFNETDLIATRALRLSQVRTPYTRPSVTLIPNAASNSVTSLPLVRELQVPSMSQLLQMKKMQHTTERSRQIATEQNSSKADGGGRGGVAAEYILPSDYDTPADSSRNQKQHTNKIKNKVTRSVRTTGQKDSTMSSIDDEAPSAPLNLPNIAFPLMQSVPKFDINLLPSTKPNKSTTESEVSTAKAETKGISSCDSQSKPHSETLKPNFTATSVATTLDSLTIPTSTPSKTTIINQFIFSTPLQLEGGATIRTQNIVPINGNYKFSAPMIVERSLHTEQQPKQQPQPQLKTGSVLDALKKPFTLTTAAVHAPAANDSLFAQFKKATNEWECDTCMIRNKQDVPKCVACETPRKLTSAVSFSDSKAAEPISTTTVFGNFGSQFKKSTNEWECDTCMIRNKQELSRCIACETPRKQASDTKESIKQSFGDAFKPKANTWECSTCLINNKSEAVECVACQTKQPGSVQFSGTSIKQVAPILPTTDDGFKTLVAAQKASKWECEACMTRNDASKLKCVCCEQAKPGSDVVSDNVPKFNFGSTAAAKFSFGFGNQNAPKEEELRKNNEKSTANESSQTTVKSGTGFTVDLTSASKLSEPSLASSGGFTFGIKPTASVPTISKVTDVKDTVDNVKTMAATPTVTPALSGFKFGAVDSLSSNTTTTTSTANSVSTSTTKAGFVFGTSTTTSATKPVENVGNAAVSTVKFSIPTTSASAPFDNIKTSNQTVSTSTFGNSTSQEPTSSTFKSLQQSVPSAGFSFGLSKPATEASKSTTAAEVPKSSGFAFKSPTTVTTAVLSTATSTFTFGTTPATVATATTTAANVKPIFSFGTITSTSSAAPTAATSSLIKPTAAGFSFGSIAAANTSASAPTKSSLFGVLPATTTTLSTQSTTSTPTTNVFSSFGAASTTGNSVFGSATPPNVSSSSSTFGTLAANSASSPFGAFSSSNNTAKPKPNANISTAMFGSNATSSSSATTFGFGSSPNVSAASACNATSTTTSTSSTTWPKNSFVFGSSSTATPSGSTAPALTSNEAAKPTAFGATSFGTSLTQAANNAPSSIFGSNPQASASSNFATAATFGSVVASTPIFGASSATVSTGVASNNNLFGGSAGTTNVTASSSTPAFGSSPFGGNNSAVAPATFGSAASSAAAGARVAPANTFGGFGTSAAASNSTDGASAAKKTVPAFNFGATSAAPQSSSGGFNFGSGAAVTKPAFNFGASTGAAASFNFTGATAEIPKSTQPFQFGATPTPLPPVFNFSGGAMEATPNATPFQFNAGSAQPATSNIFAPTPTPTGAQTAQQARRKIRAPMRRLTPR